MKKKSRRDLAKLLIWKSEIPLPMNFSMVSFTLATFDNLNYNEKNTTSGTSSTHDIVSLLFQKVSSINPNLRGVFKGSFWGRDG